MSVSDQLQQLLQEVRSAVPELKGAMVASTDGLAIAHSMSAGDPARMAAMVATALGLGKRISDTFGGGAFNETSVTGTDSAVYIYSAGNRGVLAVIAPSGANVGLINLEARSAAQKISQVLG